MSDVDPWAWVAPERAAYRAAGLSRVRRLRTGPSPLRGTLDGRNVVNFGSNDYLGLAGDSRLVDAARNALAEHGFGSGASSLVTGRTDAHGALEADLAAFEHCDAALLFPTGYAAGLGTVSALVGRGDAIFSDAKNHASLIDGCRLSGADVHIIRHGDTNHLADRLVASGPARRRLIVTDGLFSMDGDLAPLADWAEIARRFEAMLLVDEAHATGVFGRRGRGSVEALLEPHADDLGFGDTPGEKALAPVWPGILRLGTLSKALGGMGGFVVGPAEVIAHLAERARPYIFSTAAPPAFASAGQAAIEIVRREPHRRHELLARAARFRASLSDAGLRLGPSVSQIVPIVLGDAERTMAASAALAERGFWVPGIRPPTVPAGESLLRVSLSFGHTDAECDALTGAIIDLADSLRPSG